MPFQYHDVLAEVQRHKVQQMAADADALMKRQNCRRKGGLAGPDDNKAPK